MKTDQLVQHVRTQLSQCAGFEGDSIATDRRIAIDAYYMRPDGNEIAGRSTAVSGDISAMVEANLAAIMEAFQNSDRIADFDAYGIDDVEQAQLETDAVLHLVMAENNGTWHIAQAIKDCLMVRNGWVKIWIDEVKRVETETYTDVEPEALSELTNNPDAERCDVVSYDNNELVLRCTYIDRKFRAETVAPENVFYPKDYDGIDYKAIQSIPFIAERHVEPRFELLKKGFNSRKVNALKAHKIDGNIAAQARQPKFTTGINKSHDPSLDMIEWFECYVMVDGERTKVCFSANEMLKRESVRLVPYAAGATLIAAHRLTGISVYDKLRHTQGVNTDLTRALLDNVSATSLQRTAYLEGKVDADDLTNGRSSGAIRVSKHVARVSDAVMPFAVPDTSTGINGAISHQRQIRTELGGAALDMASGNMQLQKQVGSMGLDRAYSVAEQLAAHMAKNVAITLVRSIFLLSHATLREQMQTPVTIYRQGDYVETIPSNWIKRENVTIRPGMSPGERSRRQGALDKLLQTQLQLVQLGMEDVLVDINGFHSLLLDWSRVSDVPNAERYFIDPRSEASKAALKGKQEQSQEMQKVQEQLVAQALELKKMETAMQKYKADQETAFKYWAEQEATRRTEAEITGKATVELIKMEGDDDDASEIPESPVSATE